MGKYLKMVKINWEKISQGEARYRLELKREISQKGIPRETLRSFITEDLEDLRNKL